MICTNCLSAKHRASKCPSRPPYEASHGVYPRDRTEKALFGPNINPVLGSMLANSDGSHLDVGAKPTKGGH